MNLPHLLWGMVPMALSGIVGAQSPGPCYFGECEPTAPRRNPGNSGPTSPPVHAPAPTPRTTPSPPRSDPPARIPQFFARNMCFKGNAAVPVNDAQTCDRIYNDWVVRRTDGSPVECGLVRQWQGQFVIQVAYTQTVGQCFDMRETSQSNQTYGRCATRFPQGFVHWRRDLPERECLDQSHPAMILRP